MPTQAEREWSAASLGGEQQIPKSAKRESSSFLEPTQRAQDRSRGAH
jgi:hypothetical protein